MLTVTTQYSTSSKKWQWELAVLSLSLSRVNSGYHHFLELVAVPLLLFRTGSKHHHFLELLVVPLSLFRAEWWCHCHYLQQVMLPLSLSWTCNGDIVTLVLVVVRRGPVVEKDSVCCWLITPYNDNIKGLDWGFGWLSSKESGLGQNQCAL